MVSGEQLPVRDLHPAAELLVQRDVLQRHCCLYGERLEHLEVPVLEGRLAAGAYGFDHADDHGALGHRSIENGAGRKADRALKLGGQRGAWLYFAHEVGHAMSRHPSDGSLVDPMGNRCPLAMGRQQQRKAISVLVHQVEVDEPRFHGVVNLGAHLTDEVLPLAGGPDHAGRERKRIDTGPHSQGIAL